MTIALLSGLPPFAQTTRNYFTLSTWKGKAVCAVGLLAAISLIGLFIRYLRKPPLPPADGTSPFVHQKLLDNIAARFSKPASQDTDPVISPPADGTSPFVDHLVDDILYKIIYDHISPRDIVVLTALRCTCTNIHDRLFKHLSSPQGTTRFIETHIDPWIDHCSTDRCDEQMVVVTKLFQNLLCLPKNVRLPRDPNVATVPIMQAMFARVEKLCRLENFSDALTDSIGAIKNRLAKGKDRLDFQPKVAQFLYNLPSVRLISICTLTEVREVSRRHDNKLLTEADLDSLYFVCGQSGNGANGNFADAFIRGVSIPFLEQVLRVYAKRKDIDDSNEFFINQNIARALGDIKDPQDAYQKLLVCLKFYKEKYEDRFAGWTAKSSVYDVLYYILHPVSAFLYKHPFSDLLLQQDIGSWMCTHLKAFNGKRLPFKYDIVGPHHILKSRTEQLLPEIETWLKETAFIHQQKKSLNSCERTILSQLNDEFLPLDSIDKTALSLPLAPGSFFHKAIQYRLNILIEKALPTTIARLVDPYDSRPVSTTVTFNGKKYLFAFRRLETYSGYFAAMKKAAAINLSIPDGISPNAAGQVLHYLQTTTIELRDDACLELWRAACFLQVEKIRLLCEQKLIAQLTSGVLKQSGFTAADLIYMRKHGSYLSTALECLSCLQDKNS